MAEHRVSTHRHGSMDETSLAAQRGASRFVIPGIVGLAILLAVGFSFLVSDKDAKKADRFVETPSSVEKAD